MKFFFRLLLLWIFALAAVQFTMCTFKTGVQNATNIDVTQVSLYEAISFLKYLFLNWICLYDGLDKIVHLTQPAKFDFLKKILSKKSQFADMHPIHVVYIRHSPAFSALLSPLDNGVRFLFVLFDLGQLALLRHLEVGVFLGWRFRVRVHFPVHHASGRLFTTVVQNQIKILTIKIESFFCTCI